MHVPPREGLDECRVLIRGGAHDDDVGPGDLPALIQACEDEVFIELELIGDAPHLLFVPVPEADEGGPRVIEHDLGLITGVHVREADDRYVPLT